jgi:hypothetical protein
MSTLAGDFWVCGDCRSINNAGARQCYNCRTPRDRAAVDPSAIDPSTHGPLREIELPQFTSSRWVAMLASVLILAVAVLQVVQFSLAAQLLNQLLVGVDASVEQWAYVGSFVIVALGATLLALIAWSLWLSRTVTSMPALGLGYPAANGMMAFIENFVPVLNLYRVPAIVRDVVRRLEPKSGGDETMTRGEALVFAAWIGLFGGFIVPHERYPDAPHDLGDRHRVRGHRGDLPGRPHLVDRGPGPQAARGTARGTWRRAGRADGE